MQGKFVPLSIVIAALYFSQGLPGGFIGHALPAMLREANVSLEVIGAIKLLALPWLLKFLWAPVVDGHASFNGRRNWILAMQLGSCSILLLFSFLYGSDLTQLSALAIVLLLLLNTTSATQDIATDGLAVYLVPERFRGLANSIQVIGYKLGMLAGGSGLLIAVAYMGASSLMQTMALLLILLLAPLFILRKYFPTPVNNDLVDIEKDVSVLPWKAYLGFFKTPNIGLWLGVLLSYKVADSLGSSMLKPMLIDIGYELDQVGYITLIASICGMFGALLGGVVFKYIGAGKSLFVFGLLQAVCVSSFYFIAPGDLSEITVTGLVIAEQVADGASTVALFALMMWHCRERHEGADYTIQMSAQILLSGVVGALSGLIAGQLGYEGLYVFCAVISIAALGLVLKYAKQDQSHLAISK